MDLFATLKRRGILGSAYKFFARICPNDIQVRSACDRIGAYRYLKRYEYVLGQKQAPCVAKKQLEGETPIWICWLQGYEVAPPIVKRCRESIYRYASEYLIIEISNDNLEEYITIPEHIRKKHDSGIIPHAHYSDWVRISLLAAYGGIWIDSTMMLTGTLPEYINGHELFCNKVREIGKLTSGNSLIAAPSKHQIILQMKSLLEEYWGKENRLISYSIFHLFWTLVVSYNGENKRLWESVPTIYGNNYLLLLDELFTPYTERRMQQIKSCSTIHKLTYKFTDSDAAKKGTFYEKIIRGEIQ
ncbi:MAG: capsular polysaccharide synthesis protein [Bacteroidales bacterium]|nr:capsular polysaccharide synthesis protein [Bacteroidales bacterium]